MTNQDVIGDLPNGRDLGGTRCAEGTVRPGLLFRTSAPTTGAHAAAIAALGVTHVIDLRTNLEREKQRAEVPANVEVVIADVLADASYAGAANLGQLAADALKEKQSAMNLGGRDLRAIMMDSYRDFARLPSGQRAIRQVLELLASPQTGPVIVHCTAGKDRTGWLVAVVLRILGASWADITADYLKSNPAMHELFAEYLDNLPPEYNHREALEPVIGVFPEYLDAALQWAESAYLGFDVYVSEGLGVGDHTVAALRERLIVTGSGQSSSDSALT